MFFIRKTVILPFCFLTAALPCELDMETVAPDPPGRTVVCSPLAVKWAPPSKMTVQAYRDGELAWAETLASGERIHLADGPAEIKIWAPNASSPYRARNILVRTPAGACSELDIDRPAPVMPETLYAPVAVRWDSALARRDVQAYQYDALVSDKKGAYPGVRMETGAARTLIKVWDPASGQIYKERWIQIAPDAAPLIGRGAKGFEKYRISLDRSVSCPEFPPCLKDDLEGRIRDGGTDAEVLELTANAAGRPGMIVNAIAHADLDPATDGYYTLSGKFRMVPGTHPEQMDANLSRVQDSVERYAEVFLGLNPADTLPGQGKYRWVWTRNTLDGKAMRLFPVERDTGWHHWHITVSYQGDADSILCIGMDGKEAPVRLGMGRTRKTWGSHFKILLETQNKYTNCDSANVYVGKSEWDSVSVVRHASNPCAIVSKTGRPRRKPCGAERPGWIWRHGTPCIHSGGPARNCSFTPLGRRSGQGTDPEGR